MGSQARKILKGRLSSRVFSPPIREVIDCPDYASANAMQRRLCGRGLSVQAWNISPKIRELADFLDARAALQRRWVEVHPEIAFARLNGGMPIHESKKSPQGAGLRERLLRERAGIDLEKVWDRLTDSPEEGTFCKRRCS